MFMVFRKALLPISGAKLFIEMSLYTNIPMNKEIINSNNMRTNRNELMRRNLTGVTKEELEFLVRTPEEARRRIPMRGGEARGPIPIRELFI